MACGALAVVALAATARDLGRAAGDLVGGGGRKLLSSSTCKATESWEKKGGLVAYFVGVVYLFIGIAIVCDDFFVASLEKICERLGLSDDVAGATFMAAGSSAPELAASAMSLINSGADNALGVGTIVGSAVFNILVIIGATVIFAGETLKLDWRPLARDCTFYFAAIIGITLTFNGGVVNWWEGLIYVCLYMLYIAFMWKNQYFMELLDRKFGKYVKSMTDSASDMEDGLGDGAVEMKDQASRRDEPGDIKQQLSVTGSIYVGFAAQRFKAALDKDKIKKALSVGELRAIRQQTEKVTWFHHHVNRPPSPRSPADEQDADEDDADEETNPFAMPEDWKKRPMWVLSLPWYTVLTFTVPPCHRKEWENWYIVSFCVSVAYIGVISHYMVEWCARIGCILSIPPVVMGTTVLAAGTSIPDALSSISVARDGFADMAVANAVGSNVFDIWLGLGLPWTLYLSWQNPSYIVVSTAELLPSSLILLGVLFMYVSSVAMNGFQITRKMGQTYVGTYAVYALYNIFVVWVADVYNQS